MFENILISLAAAIGGAAVLTIGFRILQDLKSQSEVLKRELTIENDEKKLTIETKGNISPFEVLETIEGVEKQIDDSPHLPLQTEGAFGTKSIKNEGVIIKTSGIKSPSEVLKYDALEKGILTVNEARKIAGIEPFIEFQKVAHDFGITTKAVNVGGSTIRRAYNCKNCGGNLFENNICCYCGTLYKND